MQIQQQIHQRWCLSREGDNDGSKRGQLSLVGCWESQPAIFWWLTSNRTRLGPEIDLSWTLFDLDWESLQQSKINFCLHHEIYQTLWITHATLITKAFVKDTYWLEWKHTENTKGILESTGPNFDWKWFKTPKTDLINGITDEYTQNTSRTSYVIDWFYERNHYNQSANTTSHAED
jgi:hypothetical protein